MSDVERSVVRRTVPDRLREEAGTRDGLEGLAVRRGLRLTALIEEIDRTREAPNLSSALRVAVLRDVQDRLEP